MLIDVNAPEGSKLIDEVKVKCFIELAQTLNFSATAKQLFMTQQAVSKNIATLEKEWGIKLFQRNTRNVTLTPEGKELYEIVSKFHSDLETTLSRLKADSNSSGLRVGYQYYLKITDVLHTSLLTMQEQSPEIPLEGNRYSPRNLNELFQSKTLEMIIIYESFLENAELYETELLIEFPAFLFVAQDYPGNTLEEIVTAPFIVDCFEGQKNKLFEDRIKREIKKLGLKPSEIIVVPDRDTAFTYAELGRGVIMGTRFSHIGADRNLRQFDTGTSEKLVAAWHRDLKNPLVKQYVKALKEQFKEKK